MVYGGAKSEHQSGPIQSSELTIRQDERELQAGGHARLAEDLQRSPVKRMMPARDEDALGKVLMVGSVGWCSSIRFPTRNCWPV